jgi:hypothetical protein
MTGKKEGKGKNLIVVFILGAIAAIIGIAIGPGLYKDHQQKKVLASGVEAPATIVDIVDTGNRYNDNPEVRIILEVEPEGAEPYTAEQNTVMSPVDLVKFKPGQAVSVRYDPEDPSLVAIVGLW